MLNFWVILRFCSRLISDFRNNVMRILNLLQDPLRFEPNKFVSLCFFFLFLFFVVIGCLCLCFQKKLVSWKLTTLANPLEIILFDKYLYIFSEFHGASQFFCFPIISVPACFESAVLVCWAWKQSASAFIHRNSAFCRTNQNARTVSVALNDLQVD